jgi:hypothetical protein
LQITILAEPDVKVDNPAQAVLAIRSRVDAYLKNEKLISAKMREVCLKHVGYMIDHFGNLNADKNVKLVQDALIVQERTSTGGTNYKEMGFEIDSDPKNEALKQLPHFGSEVYWGTSHNAEHTGNEPWRFKVRGFKMHAETVKQVAPYWRHQTDASGNLLPVKTERLPTLWEDGQNYRIEFWRIRIA